MNPDLVGFEPPLGSAWSGVVKVCLGPLGPGLLSEWVLRPRRQATLAAVAQAQADVVA